MHVWWWYDINKKSMGMRRGNWLVSIPIGWVFPEKEKEKAAPIFWNSNPNQSISSVNCDACELKLNRRQSEEDQRERMVSYVNILLYGVGGLVVAGMALLVAFQEKLVYVPVLPGITKSYAINPSRLRLIYEDVWLQSSDGVRLHAWFIKLFPNCRGSISFSRSCTMNFAVTVTWGFVSSWTRYKLCGIAWEKCRS